MSHGLYERASRRFFVETHRSMSVAQKYKAFCEWMDRQDRRPSMYISTSLVSAGFALPFKIKDPQSFQRIRRLNTGLAEGMYQIMRAEGVLSTDEVIFAPDITAIPGWDEAKYLGYWGMVLTGLHPAHAEAIDMAVPSEAYSQMSNFALPRDERLSHYQRFKDDFVRAVRETGQRINPLTIVQLANPSFSHGVLTEKAISQEFGGTVLRARVNNLQAPIFENNPRGQWVKRVVQELSKWGNDFIAPEQKGERAIILEQVT